MIPGCTVDVCISIALWAALNACNRACRIEIDLHFPNNFPSFFKKKNRCDTLEIIESIKLIKKLRSQFSFKFGIRRDRGCWGKGSTSVAD